MEKKKIDLNGIKDNDLDQTSTFTDLMTRRERHKIVKDEIEEMIEEKRKNTKDLTNELEKAKQEYKIVVNEDDEKVSKTQILELTRQMKFNFEENKKYNEEKKKKGISSLNIVGEISLLCIGYYIYLLAFTNYQDSELNYLIAGSIIVLLVLLFGLSVVTSKKISNFFNILNILTIIAFIFFCTYSLLY